MKQEKQNERKSHQHEHNIYKANRDTPSSGTQGARIQRTNDRRIPEEFSFEDIRMPLDKITVRTLTQLFSNKTTRNLTA